MKIVLKILPFIGLWFITTSAAAFGAPPSVYLSVCANSATIPECIKWNKGVKLNKIQINLNNSNVQVESVKGLDHIVFVLVGCASSPQLLHSLGFRVDEPNHHEFIITLLGVKNLDFSSSLNHKNYAYAYMRMQVPESVAVTVNSNSGNIIANNLSELAVNSDSGSIRIKNIQGLFSANSGSGDIYGQDLGRVKLGKVESGSVRILDVVGNLKAKSLGSGTINFTDVQGNVIIKSLGTGDVEIGQVGGDVTVQKTGIGRVVVDNIGGNFNVRHNEGSKISYSKIKGAVSVAQSND